MKDATESAEAGIRETVEEMGHELTAVTVDEYDEEAVINVEFSVELEEEKENQFRVK